MNRILCLLVGLFPALLLAQSPDSWQPRATFPGTPRQDASAFSALGKGYVVGGVDSAGQLLNDMWSYDPATDSWTAETAFPGPARRGAVAFSIRDTGYYATGYDGTSQLADCWRFVPGSNSWTRVQDLGQYRTGNFPGRSGSCVVTTDSLAYLICGYDGTSGYVKQVLLFNPIKDTTWSAARNFSNLSDLTLSGRRWPAGFAINSLIYAGTGFTNSQDIKSDMWRYDPAQNSWTQQADFGGGFRSNAFGFALNGKGYVGGGTNGGASADMWCYLPSVNRWTSVASFGGGPRLNTWCFTLGNRAYVGGGSDQNGSLMNDCWEYTPDSTTSLSEIATPSTLPVSIRSVENGLEIECPFLPGMTGELNLNSLQGALVLKQTLHRGTNRISLPTSTPSLMAYVVYVEGQPISSGKFVH